MTWVAVGTAAAIGAGVGAGSQLIQGKSGDDVLRGALLGGATGALTGGAGAALGGSAGATGSSLTTEAAAQLAPELTQAAATNIAPEIVSQAATNVIPEVAGQAATSAAPAGIAQIPSGLSAAELNAINLGQADALAASGNQFAPLASGPVGSDAAVTPLVQTPPPQFQSMTRPELAQMTFAETGQYPVQPLTLPPGAPAEAPITSSGLVSEPPTNPFVEGFKSVTDYIEKNPFKSAAMGYLGLNAIGAFQNAQQPMTFGEPSYSQTYTLSPNFQGGPYSRPNVYQERRYNYASGGILSLSGGQPSGPVEAMSMNDMKPGMYPLGMVNQTYYSTPSQRPASMEVVKSDYDTYVNPMTGMQPTGMASGGITALRRGGRSNASESLDKYLGMMEGQKPAMPAEPAFVRSRGIVEDTDVDTKYQDALTAALIRQGKINKRAGMGTPTLGRPTPMGTINLAPPGVREAAAGGIMGYSLGGYADGGNPRLLKGPGDGMSDNIPATIANRQPARLADGEFVIPADVVSGLGNGSTNAGARKLHKMMDKVRMARTGKKKQAPAIKGEKYLA